MGDNPFGGPEIETDRLRLCQATGAHLSDWAARVFADPDVIRYMPKRDMTPYARAERALNNYRRLWMQHKVGGWVITGKVDAQLFGSCEIEYLDETDEYELGYALGRAYWGNGIATEAAQAATRFGFESAGLERIMAVVVPENSASWRVLQHIGFTYEKNARYYDLDVVYYAITRDKFRANNSFYRVHETGPS
jgi:ribosomal-protein-alanine N-acetyltransferase